MSDVTLDRQNFKQIMFNLLSNAVKFTDDGGRVWVDIESQDAMRVVLESEQYEVRDADHARPASGRRENSRCSGRPAAGT